MIITHTNPDFDAICGVWLLKRFGGLENEPILFVNTGNPDPELLEKAVAVVDTGRKLDALNRRFDHHHLPGSDANNVCAALQVYTSLKNFADIAHIKPLVDLIFAGDTGRSEANASRELGLHAILSGYKAWSSERNPDARLSDEEILDYGFGLLDVLEVRLRKQAQARAELTDKTVYKSLDGLVWAIKHGSQGSSFAAYEEGARIVIFEGKPVEVKGGTTYPVGIMRAGEWQEPDVGNLAKRLVKYFSWSPAGSKKASLKSELETWFFHPGGFFAGRGTAKAPVFKPIEIDLVLLAEEIDKIWWR